MTKSVADMPMRLVFSVIVMHADFSIYSERRNEIESVMV